jgi:diguanylate cyclase (GGDEF)-like protein/PAS domain S-box-containing protein
MSLDLPTLLWVLPMTCLVLAVAVLMVGWKSPHQDGLATWGLGLVLHALSYPAYGLRMAGWTLTSVLVSNFLSAATIAIHTTAVMQLQPSHQRPFRTALVWAPVGLIELLALALMQDNQWRTAASTLVLGGQSALLAWVAWGTGQNAPRERGRWLLACGSVALVVMFVVRAVMVLRHTDWNTHFVVPAGIQSTTYLVTLAVLLLNTQGFVLMQKERSERALADGERRYRRLIEAANEGICIVEGGMLRLVNRRMAEMSGYAEAELLDQSLALLIDPRDQALVLGHHEKRRAGQADNLRYAARIRMRSGEMRWWEIGGVAIEWNGQHAALNFITDITDRRETEDRLRLAANVFTHAYEGILLADAQTRIVDVNDAFCRITGYTRDEVLGQKPSMLQSGRHPVAFYEAMWQDIRRHGFWQGEIWNRRKSGDVYPESLSIRAIPDAQGLVHQYVAMFSDITQRKAMEEEIRRLAFLDPLTELPNRRLLMDRLQLAIATARRSGTQGALMFVDLDRFKFVNDHYGHEAGDDLLVEVANRLQSCVRETDTVARFGGDEFVLLFPTLDPDGERARALAIGLAQKVLAALEVPHHLRTLDPQGIDSTVEHRSPGSLGIALFQGHSVPDDVLKAADNAMYQAKEAGRNTFCLPD